MSFKRKTGISFLLVFILVFSCLLMTVSAEKFPFVGRVTENSVNVRTAPSLDAAVESLVNQGVLVDVFEKNGDWYKIGTSPSTYAYIYAAYVENFSTETVGDKAVANAKKFLGTPYRYGGTSPSGFDCSGLVYYVYKELGYTLNRTADGMLANGTPVEKKDLIPGDIVMFKRPGNSYVHHVGIYVGDGMMIHSPQTGDVVKYTSIVSGNYNNVYYTARRIAK
ncbi:MAG: C40 family peptidase [Clostridia bacterium]|nr:C40 family peptidase [Clostridia bacterium]